MKNFTLLALASASVAAIVSAATPQTASAADAAAAAPADEATLGEIVVTARRRSESLQEVPQTVNAVTSEALQKLNITQFQDVQNVVPGMTLSNQTNGYAQSASMRGITFDQNTAAPLGTVAMYINDAPVENGFIFDSLFDVGQIEVLRGPQGTTRGVSTPSGAMTATTRKPDPSGFGGYVNVTGTDQHGRNAQGALNIPVIEDVLAVRAAGLIDQNDGDGTRSLHNALRQSIKTTAERISVSFEPTDRLNANVMYEHIDKNIRAFDQVSGPGQGNAVNPPLSPFDRAAVEDGISNSRVHHDLVTAQIDSRILGQHLSYVGSYQHTWITTKNLGVTNNADVGNILPGVELYNYEDVGAETTTHEVRLASDPAPGRFFDYTVGAYYSWVNNFGDIFEPPVPAQGAFGAPFTPPNLAAYNPAYTLSTPVATIPSTHQETSIFGNVTLHLGANTELSGGIRHIWSVFNAAATLDLGHARLPLPASLFGGSCGAGGTVASAYPGYCDLTLALGGRTFPFRASESPNIYQVSLSHHFSRDLLAYVNTGTSFRPAFNSPGLIASGILGSTDPLVQSLYTHPSERSRSYEIGFKWTFLDGRARLNADVYRQRFHNFTFYVPNINYVGDSGVSNFAFTAPVDALVQGFEIDAAYQITRDWNVGLLASYADGTTEGSQVPCNTFDAAGAPTFNHTYVSFCPGGSVSRQPYWNATLTSEYAHPVANNVDGFIRGLFSYYPKNENRAEPNFTVDSYGLLNLYAGLRSQDGAWEVSLFAKNALENKTVLDKSPLDANLNALLVSPAQFGYQGSFPSNSGYYPTQVTPRREVGVNVRYAWGAR